VQPVLLLARGVTVISRIFETTLLIEPEELLTDHGAVVFDCRFSLADIHQGRLLHQQGHIPGAHYLDLNRDMAGAMASHGGRHPLPEPQVFAATLARFGVGPDTAVVAYDDSRLAFAARLWWLMRAAGYRPPRLLNGGFGGFLGAGGVPESAVPQPQACMPGALPGFSGFCDIDGVRLAQAGGALLVDAREPPRYEGLQEPIDPVAGHIPGAINRPWQRVTTDAGRVGDTSALQAHWGDALAAQELVVYCGSGVTACANLFSLALLGRDDATLYVGGWSDWCSYL
jgi:thiosulfate/3-mercaptopyruvate sulfurtransferase